VQAGLFWAAAAASLVTLAVHTFVGGAFVARPLLSDQSLPKAAKWLANGQADWFADQMRRDKVLWSVGPQANSRNSPHAPRVGDTGSRRS
jgi:hypothetical protein